MKKIFRVAVVLVVTVFVFGAGYVAFAKPITALIGAIWGAGTTDQIPKFTSQTTIGDSGIMEDASGNVGIGTATPAGKLHVTGGNAVFDGNVGIGTTNPAARLHVSGGNVTIGDINQNYLLQVGVSTDPTKRPLRVGSGEYGSNIVISVAPGIVNFDAPGIPGGRLKIDSIGNVGIGTAVPTEKLEVAGNVKMGYEVITNTVNNVSVVLAQCSAGKQVLGGGCDSSGGNLVESTPRFTTGWTCQYDGPQSFVQARAICANIR